jgi:hypothetical protein
MFLLFMQHGHHLSWPLAVLVVAFIAVRLFIRRSGGGRGSRGAGRFGR